MFRENKIHLQKNIFGLLNTMPEAMKKHAIKSEEYHFYHLIYCTIDEALFSELYSDKKSRPNSPINSMVSALIFQNRRMWSYEELFQNIRFNILFRIALGLDDLESMPFCMATLFNFQNRLNDHFIKTGENLLEMVFDRLSEKQLKMLKLKTDIQRTDSTLAASNIRNYSRVQLLVEMIIRIYRLLSDEDKIRYKNPFQKYSEKTSGQYIYKLSASDLPHELKQIGQFFSWIYRNLRNTYGDHSVFKTFERVYHEHFTVVKRKVRVKPSKELHSGCVQSPDDLDATFRNKNGKKSRGQSIHVTETANPENPIQLVTDIAHESNNVDDSVVLNTRIDILKEKTPGLNELHFDGAFGSDSNDQKFQTHKILPIQTGVRGPETALRLMIDQVSETQYRVRCPNQMVDSQPTRKRHKAVFDLSVCRQCKDQHHCPAKLMKSSRTFYFAHQDYLKLKRLRRIYEIPPERRKLRNNVEATIKEFTCKMPGGKLKVRGAFKTSIFAYSMGISINFGRIFRLVTDDTERFSHIVKEQVLLFFNKISDIFITWSIGVSRCLYCHRLSIAWHM